MNEKTKGVIAYLFGWVGGLIIFLGFKDSTKETKVHAAQAIVLSVAYMIISFAISFIPYIRYISYLLSLAYLALAIIGCVKAYNLQEYELPIISEQAKKIFAKQINE